MHSRLLKQAALLGTLAVALGAFGAHALKQLVSANAVSTFETGVRYQFYHVFAILLAGLLYKEYPTKRIVWAGNLFIIGTALFSGSLYVLTGFTAMVKPIPVWIGAITPLGGVAFIAGWIMLLTGIKKQKKI